MVPLGLLRPGEEGEILQIAFAGGFGQNCKAEKDPQLVRIVEMGIRPGKRFRILSNQPGHSLIVVIDNSRIALGRGISMKILVRRMA